MLIALRDHLSSQGIASLAELSERFDVSPDAMRGMLSHWIRKGKLIREQSGCSKGCVSCSPEQLEMYRWLETGADSIPLCQLD
ncbi:FeoC-like transcriptional regulator [Endozoicomonas euniceicola]|uniref:FeoC-like transcriptional regulator n=1 Tax=Endozoicomonas euniceicola TaxID=1234143 RepID=A0ABY6GUI9_9GAMM|nr:FeoC-like transcriptional regulator [Endozoicomonas euniceicola]UYM15746.1 FeoC-like transcriptional regulator [Endozoicomonas euniceicola]